MKRFDQFEHTLTEGQDVEVNFPAFGQPRIYAGTVLEFLDKTAYGQDFIRVQFDGFIKRVNLVQIFRA